jgi:hypothetical protein
MPALLILEWSYTPADCFEAPVDYTAPSYTVHIENGRVVAAFATDQPDSVFPNVHNELEARFLGAQIMRNRPFQLSGYNTRRTSSDGSAVVSVSAGITGHAQVGAVDIVIRDAAGNVTSDTKADRVNATNEFAQLASKHRNDSVAEALLKSYNGAIDDPSNELTHLYEIRDALAKKFGGDNNACSMLNISRNEWSQFGKLANDDPLYEGRHRGQNVGQLGHATESELNEARGIARKMILAYLNYLG